MEPLPEVREAATQLNRLNPDTDFLGVLGDVADRAQRLVPSCVGVSVTVLVDDRPYTLTSTSDEIAVLDGAQYVDGGPCVDAARTLDQVDVLDVLDEQRWTLFARAAGASGVRSTLSMPLYAAGSQLPGAINLYASEPDAFAGSRDELAAVFHAPVESLVDDADLSFTTRDRARELPDQVAEDGLVDVASGILLAERQWSPQLSRRRMQEAADQAHVSLSAVARTVIELRA
ncbi:GAF domain-containing protein [Angustibacter aerolatus]